MKTVIRDYHEADFSSLLNLIGSIIRHSGAETDQETLTDYIRENIDFHSDHIKILEVEDKGIIGYYRYIIEKIGDRLSKRAYLLDIDVVPKYQRKRYGTKLMTNLINELREKGIHVLFSRTFEKNTGSIEFHKKNGFVIQRQAHESIFWVLEL